MRGLSVCVDVVCVYCTFSQRTLAHGLQLRGGAVRQGLPQVEHLDHSQDTQLSGWGVFAEPLRLHTHRRTFTNYSLPNLLPIFLHTMTTDHLETV